MNLNKFDGPESTGFIQEQALETKCQTEKQLLMTGKFPWAIRCLMSYSWSGCGERWKTSFTGQEFVTEPGSWGKPSTSWKLSFWKISWNFWKRYEHRPFRSAGPTCYTSGDALDVDLIPIYAVDSKVTTGPGQHSVRWENRKPWSLMKPTSVSFLIITSVRKIKPND